MPTTMVRKGQLTFEEFVDIVQDGQKADLIDGVLYLASPDSLENNDLNVWLSVVLRLFVGKKNGGKVYTSRVHIESVLIVVQSRI